MRSFTRPVRFPEDFDKAVKHLADEQGKTRTQLVRGALIMAWQEYFENHLGAGRLDELVAEYTRPGPKREGAEENGKGEAV